MKLFVKTFTNERGAKIDLVIDDGPASHTIIIKMRGPNSTSVSTITYREAAELRDALKTISI